MEAFIQRLYDERKELKARIGLLDAFTLTTRFKSISKEHQELLYEQVAAMRDYDVALSKRIALLG